MDVLSDVLREFRVDGSVFCRFEAAAPWAVRYPASAGAAFHVVTEGGCALAALDQLAADGRLGRRDTVVLFNTGSGASYRAGDEGESSDGG